MLLGQHCWLQLAIADSADWCILRVLSRSDSPIPIKCVDGGIEKKQQSNYVLCNKWDLTIMK